jgi:hypothetical protein
MYLPTWPHILHLTPCTWLWPHTSQIGSRSLFACDMQARHGGVGGHSPLWRDNADKVSLPGGEKNHRRRRRRGSRQPHGDDLSPVTIVLSLRSPADEHLAAAPLLVTHSCTTSEPRSSAAAHTCPCPEKPLRGFWAQIDVRGPAPAHPGYMYLSTQGGSFNVRLVLDNFS